jgi:SpoIID/LytB domain protein
MRPRCVSLAVLCLATLALPLLAAAQQGVPQQSEEEWIRMKAEQGDSHASGLRPELGPVALGNPGQAVVTLRVGLYYSYTSAGAYSEFSTLHHPVADIGSTAGDVHVIDRATGKQIVATVPGAVVHVTHDGTGYQVAVDGAALGTFAGPIFFRPTDAANRFRVESIRRSYGGTQVPLYRGAIEIARGTATLAGRVNVVNVVEVEDYVPGVVVNESLASFHVEALKAQAIAARGYAISNIGRFGRSGYPFDIVDSSSSQVYRGAISEHAKAVAASADTTGLVASYEGQIIGALYSSSFGGHSENNEWVFNSPADQLPGTNAVPYLRAIYDGDGVPPDFGTDAGIAAFWAQCQPDLFDGYPRIANRFSRWKLTLTAAQIKQRFTTMANRIVVVSGDTTGSVTDVELVTRMPGSARWAIARITLDTGVVEVRGWDNLRNVLGRTAQPEASMCGGTATATNFTLNNPSVIEVTQNGDGTLASVTAWGGGWGHNLGLSQYGSNGRANAGQNFLQILKAYYTGVDVGSYPIDIGREPGTGTPTLRQQFFAPDARGTLVVRAEGMKGLRVHINGLHDLSLGAAQLAAGVVRVDVSQYLVAGINTVQYNPVGRQGRATVTVLVE